MHIAGAGCAKEKFENSPLVGIFEEVRKADDMQMLLLVKLKRRTV